MLNDILILDQQWLPNQSDFPPISWPWYRAWPSLIMSGFHGAFATGVACQQGTLTLPDTWFRPPFWDLLMLQLLRPNSSNLPCLYSTFHLEYPLVLSRFCFWRGRGIKRQEPCSSIDCIVNRISGIPLSVIGIRHLFPLPGGAGSTVPREGFDSSVIISDETIISDVAESIAKSQPISINRIQNF